MKVNPQFETGESGIFQPDHKWCKMKHMKVNPQFPWQKQQEKEYFFHKQIELELKKKYLLRCVRKVAVHFLKVLEVMSMSVYTGLNPN
jgi:hypothetical protein